MYPRYNLTVEPLEKTDQYFSIYSVYIASKMMHESLDTIELTTGNITTISDNVFNHEYLSTLNAMVEKGERLISNIVSEVSTAIESFWAIPALCLNTITIASMLLTSITIVRDYVNTSLDRGIENLKVCLKTIITKDENKKVTLEIAAIDTTDKSKCIYSSAIPICSV